MAGVKGRFLGKLEDEQGAVMALVALMMIGLLGFMALAVDVGHLYMVRNELQNAADAGALAGASVLYNDNATRVNAGANQAAYDAATSNRASIFPSGWSAVQVNWTGGTNAGDVQRGHYNYVSREFIPNDAPDPPANLTSGNEMNLNADHNFINAVRVVTRTSTNSLFARFLLVYSSDLSAEAIAYIGYSNQLNPWDIKAQIALCEDLLVPAASPCAGTTWTLPDPTNPGYNPLYWISLTGGDIHCNHPNTGNSQEIRFDSAPMPITAITSSHSSNLSVCWSSLCPVSGPPCEWDIPVIQCASSSSPVLGRVRISVQFTYNAALDIYQMNIQPVCETVNGTLQPVRPLTGRTGSQIYGQRGQLAKYPVLVK